MGAGKVKKGRKIIRAAHLLPQMSSALFLPLYLSLSLIRSTRSKRLFFRPCNLDGMALISHQSEHRDVMLIGDCLICISE